MSFQFRLPALFLIISVAAVLLFIFDSTQVIIWSGHFPLLVKLIGTENREIVKVEFETLGKMEYAEYVRTAPDRLELDLERANWTEGQSFEVKVPCSGRNSNFGRKLSYFQFQLLVLRISYKNGEVEHIPVQIPDGRTNREATVDITKR